MAVTDLVRKRHPGVADIERACAISHGNLGVEFTKQNNYAEAEAEARICRDIHLEVANRYPSIRRNRRDLANAHADLGYVLWQLNKRRDCAEEDKAAVTHFQRLIAEVPTDRKSRSRCVQALNRLGEYRLSLGTRDSHNEAISYFRTALKLIDEAPPADRADGEFLRVASPARWGLGHAHLNLKQPSDAIREFQTALTQLDVLMKEAPDDRAVRQDRALVRYSLGVAFKEADRLTDAEASFQAALAGHEEEVRRDPKDFTSRNGMANCYRGLASLHRSRNRPDDTLRAFQTECDIRAALVADSPTPGYRYQLGRTLGHLAWELWERGRHTEAEKEYRASIAVSRELATEYKKNRTYQLSLAVALTQLAHRLMNQKRFAEAEPLVVEADRLYPELNGNPPTDPEFKTQYSSNMAFLAGIRAHAGGHETANVLLTKMMTLESNMLTHISAACVLGHCVRAAERDATLADRQQRINQYTDRALGYLRRGVELSGGDPNDRRHLDQIRTDKDLDPFRTHPEFKKILAEIQKVPERAPPPREVKP